MEKDELNKLLLTAVEECNHANVKKYLELGADANYTTFKDSDEPNGYIQPTTPLRMVMFRLSDNLLTDNELNSLKSIAKYLLKNNANPEPALEIAAFRYGKYNPNSEKNALTETWDMIAKAAKKTI